MVVSEYMPNPFAVADSVGEWMELRNTTPNTINLSGFVVRDQGIDQFVLPALSIPSHGYVTLANSGNSERRVPSELRLAGGTLVHRQLLG